MPGVGDKLGRYTLLKRLAVGGMGEVFVAAKAGPVGFGPYVALKVLRDELSGDPQFVDMLVDEANITKHLNHQNLVSVLDLGEDEGFYYIAMEFVQGITAERLIESLVERHRKLELPLALHVGIELCRALRYAHSRTNEAGEPLGIIHRDVTPANILISTEGEVKLTDFGIARAKGRIHHTQAGVLKGKFGYMAPEMVRYEELDGRADLFCAGVALYLLAAGRHPVAHASVMEAIQRYENKRVSPPSEANPEITPDIDHVLLKALEPRPDDRWQTAAEMGEAMQAILLSHPSWRDQARGAAGLLAARVREVAPETFGEVVSRPTLARLASVLPSAGLDPRSAATAPARGAVPDEETDENLSANGVMSDDLLDEDQVEASPSFPGAGTDSSRPLEEDLALEEPELPGGVEPTVPVDGGQIDESMLAVLAQERTVAGYAWAEPSIDRAVEAEDDEDGETVVGVSLDEVEGAPAVLEGETLGSRGTRPTDPPTIIPVDDGHMPSIASASGGGVWGAESDPGATLLEGLSLDPAVAGAHRKPSTDTTDLISADDQIDPEDDDQTYVRSLEDPAGGLGQQSTAGSPRVDGPLRIRLDPDGAPALATSPALANSEPSSSPAGQAPRGGGEVGPRAHAPSPSAAHPGVGTDTGRWMAGEVGAAALEWSDEAAGRRAVATRNQAFDDSAHQNPAPDAHDNRPIGSPGGLNPDRGGALLPGPGGRVYASSDQVGLPPVDGGDDPPYPAFLQRNGPLLVVFAVAVAVAVGFGYLWFMTELLWPTLRLDTVPSGAQIVVDGVPMAEPTPTSITVAPGRRHRIELRADGYAPALREITEGIGRGRTYALEVALEPAPRVLHVAPVEGRALVNGSEVGRGRDIRLPQLPDEGPVRIRVEAEGYEAYEVIFDSADAIPTSLDIPLEERS